LKHPLTKIVSWSHELLKEVVTSGDLVVDLTAGNGYDTLLLWQLVGPDGRVVAFDIQDQALKTTERRLLEAGAVVRWIAEEEFALNNSGVNLLAASHTEMDKYSISGAKAIIANLGYLPGGDLQLVTRPETTLVALGKACGLLAPGGRLAVVIYPGHNGGREEAEQVDTFFQNLPDQDFHVLCLRVGNRPQAPYLQVAEKHHRERASQQ